MYLCVLLCAMLGLRPCLKPGAQQHVISSWTPSDLVQSQGELVATMFPRGQN